VIAYHEASPTELESWDDRTVLPAGGHVLQSRAWADFRSRTGWMPRFLIGSDGSAVLALVRSWPLNAGTSAYLSRGPIPNGTIEELVDRLAGAASWLGDNGVDVIASDAEIAAWTGYPERIARLGFKPIEEIEPSRHRLVLQLGPRIDEEAVFNTIATSTRRRIRQAEGQLVQVVRYDAAVERDDVGPDFVARDDAPEMALARFHGYLSPLDGNGPMPQGPRAEFLDWSWSAFRAGYLVLLEARGRDGAGIAGVVLYRHGGRLSVAFAGALDAATGVHPGVHNLLRWRAIQLAVREGCSEMDLGGVDGPGAHGEPLPGDPLHTLYQEKRSFGAEWLELAGAHELVDRRTHHLVSPITNRVLRPAWPVPPGTVEPLPE